MEYRKLHPWDISPTEAVVIQNELRRKLRVVPLKKGVRYVAGADISFERFSDTVYAAFVVLDLKTLEIVAFSEAVVDVKFPYIPGLLTFREGPALLKAWENLKKEPDVIVFDGQGIAHPRRLGIAAHMGLILDRPSIGCGKSLLVGTLGPLGENAGSTANIFHKYEKVGVALRTKSKVAPVYISIGHKADLDSSIELILKTVKGYRIPEPTRQAHLWVNRMRVAARSQQPDLFSKVS